MNNFRFLEAKSNSTFPSSNVLNATGNYLMKKLPYSVILISIVKSTHHNIVNDLTPLISGSEN